MATFLTTESADDAVEVVSTTAVSITGSSGTENQMDGTNHLGFRFQNVTVVQGATISSAVFKFEEMVNFSGFGTVSDTTVHGDDTDSSAAFAANNGDISGRARTTASVAGSSLAATEAQWKTTGVDVTSIVQEIIDRAGWVSGNDLAILFIGDGSADAQMVHPYMWDYFTGFYQASLEITTAGATTTSTSSTSTSQSTSTSSTSTSQSTSTSISTSSTSTSVSTSTSISTSSTSTSMSTSTSSTSTSQSTSTSSTSTSQSTSTSESTSTSSTSTSESFTTSTSSTSTSISTSSTSTSQSTSTSSTSTSASTSTSSTSTSFSTSSTSTSQSTSTSSTSTSQSTSTSTSTSSTSTSQSTSTSISTSTSSTSTSVSTSTSTSSTSTSSTSTSISTSTTLPPDVFYPRLKMEKIVHTDTIMDDLETALMDDESAIMDDDSVVMGGPTAPSTHIPHSPRPFKPRIR